MFKTKIFMNFILNKIIRKYITYIIFLKILYQNYKMILFLNINYK